MARILLFLAVSKVNHFVTRVWSLWFAHDLRFEIETKIWCERQTLHNFCKIYQSRVQKIPSFVHKARNSKDSLRRRRQPGRGICETSIELMAHPWPLINHCESLKLQGVPIKVCLSVIHGGNHANHSCFEKVVWNCTTISETILSEIILSETIWRFVKLMKNVWN
jgi:hypothetical protein